MGVKLGPEIIKQRRTVNAFLQEGAVISICFCRVPRRVSLCHFGDIATAIEVRHLSEERLLLAREIAPPLAQQIQMIVAVNGRIFLQKSVPFIEEIVIYVRKIRQGRIL